MFGGTFDPVHLGHTIVAVSALESLDAEKLIFIPAQCSPLKTFLPQASGEDRVEMLRLAVHSQPKFRVSTYELDKSRPNYTLETVRHFKQEFDDKASIYWLVGADSIDELPRWYKIAELIDECSLCVMYRGGCEPPNFSRFEGLWSKARIEKLQDNVIATPLIDISSTEIRAKLAKGEDVSGMLAPQVAEYIRRHNLYR